MRRIPKDRVEDVLKQPSLIIVFPVGHAMFHHFLLTE